jgi:hypothetical protein
METTDPMLADGFKLSVEGGQVVIEFGQGAGLAADGRQRVAVTDRIVLPRVIAERLMSQLDDALKPHAAALRLDQTQTLTPAQAAVAERQGPVPARPAQDQSGARAAELIQAVGALGVPHQYERSFRISRAGLSANRFLLTLDPRDIVGDARARIMEICERMRMPDAARRQAAERFAQARCVHFGFEGDSGSIICKLYLERLVPPEEAVGAGKTGAPLHLAFKWDLLKGGFVTTHYHWFPALSVSGIEARFDRVYGGGDGASRRIASEVLRHAAERAPAERLQYLEVWEEENDRRSFDLNLYNSKMSMRDVQSAITAMRDHFGVRPGHFQALYDQVRGLALGHLAGGVHRGGEDFFNLYYGVVTLPRFSDGFARGGGG